MANSKTRLGVSAYAIVVFVFTLGSNGVRNLIGWPGFIIAAVAIAAVGAVLFLRLKPERFRWYRLPAPIYLFLALAALSIIWSQYTLESLLGTVAQLLTTFVAVTLAFVLSWHEVLRTLGTALRYVIGLSFVFELVVSLFVREPLLPWWVELTAAQEEKTPKLLYWSRDLLFEGGPIQGLVGSSTLFGFIGLIGLIVFTIQLRAKLVTRFAGWFWVVMAVAALLLTRSATVTVALAAVVVALAFALWARRTGPERRVPSTRPGPCCSRRSRRCLSSRDPRSSVCSARAATSRAALTPGSASSSSPSSARGSVGGGSATGHRGLSRSSRSTSRVASR